MNNEHGTVKYLSVLSLFLFCIVVFFVPAYIYKAQGWDKSRGGGDGGAGGALHPLKFGLGVHAPP